MQAHGKIWIFYDRLKKKKSKPLSLVHAQATILNLLSKDTGRFYLWTPGWKEWVPLGKFLESDQNYFVITPETTEVTKNIEDINKIESFNENTHSTIIQDELTATKTLIEAVYTKVVDQLPSPSTDYGYYHPDFKAEQIDIHLKPNLEGLTPNYDEEGSERRINPRYNYKIEVLIVSKKGKTFKTFSDDISLGGTLLQDPIPRDFLNAPFDLIIVNRFEIDPKKARLNFSGRVVGDFRDPRRLMFMNPEPELIKSLQSLLKSYTAYQENQKRRVG